MSGFTAGSGANTVVVTDTFTTLKNLNSSAIYDYYVRAICGSDDTSAYSDKGNFSTLCAVPADLSALGGESNQTEVSWTETGSASSWEIQYGAPGFTAGSGSSVVANSNPYTVTGLNVSRDYEVYVRAICGVGDASAFSKVASFSTTACDSVTNLASSDLSVDTANLDWMENGTAIDWEVSYGPVGFTAGNGTEVIASGDNPFTLKGLDPETEYDWYVRAVCAVGDSSSWSDTASFTTPRCFAPSGLSYTNISLGSTSVSWKENGGATEWEIEFDTVGFASGTGNRVSAFDNKFTLMNLTPGITYEWHVRAVCTTEDSSLWSDMGTFTTIPNYYAIGTVNKEDANGVADSLNTYCWISGTVMGVDLDGNAGLSFYITDMSSGSQEGINVFNFNDVSDYEVNQGDSIRARGSIIQFRGLTELNVDSIELISSGNGLPQPAFASVLDETTEAKLIALYDLIVVTGSSTSNGSYNMTAATHDRSDTLTIRIDGDTDVDDSLTISGILPGDTICKIVGIGGQFDGTVAPFLGGYQIIPMEYSAIDVTSCINIVVGIGAEIDDHEDAFSVYPNPSNGEFIIKGNVLTASNLQITVRDINGRMISDELFNAGTGVFQQKFFIGDEAKGMYFVSILNGDQLINKKLILR